MFAHCLGPVWQVDDFTRCFRLDYLNTLFPAILCSISLVLLLFGVVHKAFNNKYYYAFTILNRWHHVWDLRMPPPVHAVDDTDSASIVTDIDDEIARNAQLALKPTASQANRTSAAEEDRPRGESLLVMAELLALLSTLGVRIALFILYGLHSDAKIAFATEVAVWTYICVLGLCRLGLSLSQESSFSRIWYHTAALYGFQWVFSIVDFRSLFIHPSSTTLRYLVTAYFALTSFLFLVALTSRKGNKPVQIEYEGDIPPAREPLASMASLITFTWVDSIIWNGYRKTVEISDVWNLPLKDKAATVISDYRQCKKTFSLAWHLLAYFKRELLIQEFWAVCSGFLMFVPTLLLRAILRYVENPDSVPLNTAWLYVVLLFLSGFSSAIADGQALWIGRKVCFRLRAVVIGELYSKALKRRIGTTGEKVLGQEENIPPKSLRQRLNPFAKKAKDASQKKDSKDEAPEQSNSQATSGAVINLMSVDSFKIADITAYLHFLWGTTPIQFVVCIVLLWNTMGPSALAGIIIMGLILPANLFIAQKFSAIQKKILAATDARINTTNEVLTNIRIIKYFAWEQRFIDSVDEKRSTEIKELWGRYILWSSASTLWNGTPILITLASFAFYTMVEKKSLIPSVAFTALSLFQILRVPLDQLADMVAHVQEYKVSVDRVEEFLSEKDTLKYKQLKSSRDEDQENKIGFTHATFTWGNAPKEGEEEDEIFRMFDLNIDFKIGQMNIVAGPTGSGKTSLLMALLGEMTKLTGDVFLPGGRSREDIAKDPDTGLTESVAYCAQQAWLVNDTVKQNILFASPWNPQRYADVVEACSLKKDFQILDSGDETLVGEKGVTLSGGQKQRISLARALYSDARHLLLDDILSAVDSHTAQWIFDKALIGPLMENRTCILVTHNVSLCLPRADYAIILDNGRVSVQGTADDVIASGKLNHELSTLESRPHSGTQTPVAQSPTSSITANGDANGANGQPNGHIKPDGDMAATQKHDTPATGPIKASEMQSPTHHEKKAEGAVSLRTIFLYLGAMGGWFFWSVAIFFFFGQQLLQVATNVWIRNWSNAFDRPHYSTIMSRGVHTPSLMIGMLERGPILGGIFHNASRPILMSTDAHSGYLDTLQSPQVDHVYYIGVYGFLGVLYLIATFGRDILLFWGSIAASKLLHSRLIAAVSYAKFRFFDSTPLGQIMNRFSKDIENIDQEIAPVAMGMMFCLAQIATVVILISVVVPAFLVAGLMITLAFSVIGALYIRSCRDLKRLESVQRSPLYQQFGESLSGMTTIRAYGDERRFIRTNLSLINTHNRPFMYLWATNRWLSFRIDLAGALVSFFTGMFVILGTGKIDPGAAGLILSYAVSFTEYILWFVRLYSSNEQNMNSVERIKEYLDVEQEADARVPGEQPPRDWPSYGTIEFIDYSTRYRSDFDMVLKNINLSIRKCEKVGVVGRTGAGKSSLALALFRALEAEEGKILVDDIDIGKIGLHDLRESIVMVPQDPTLFSGTIRSNLDPFGIYTDEEIFTALRRVQLIGPHAPSQTPASRPSTPLNPMSANSDRLTPISFQKYAAKKKATDAAPEPPSTPSSAIGPRENRNPFNSLSTVVSESGGNLSQGQRQLLCLARALLKQPRVLLMDEATASIDYATDSKIQETIRELKDNTIITIAHRLKTIVDYDRVVVLELGELVEVGSPWELLRPDEEVPEGVESSTVRGKKRRWFREMCMRSGELEVLEREARKSWERSRLVDAD